MKKSVWGPCIWKTIHTLTVKIKDSEFNNQKKGLIDIIYRICTNLPCPMCSSHCRGLLRKYNVTHINTKEGLIKVMFKIHNDVNIRLKKSVFKYEELLSLYKSYNIRDVLNDYYNKTIESKFSEKMMLHNFHKMEFLKFFKNYVLKHIDYFEK